MSTTLSLSLSVATLAKTKMSDLRPHTISLAVDAGALLESVRRRLREEYDVSEPGLGVGFIQVEELASQIEESREEWPAFYNVESPTPRGVHEVCDGATVFSRTSRSVQGYVRQECVVCHSDIASGCECETGVVS